MTREKKLLFELLGKPVPGPVDDLIEQWARSKENHDDVGIVFPEDFQGVQHQEMPFVLLERTDLQEDGHPFGYVQFLPDRACVPSGFMYGFEFRSPRYGDDMPEGKTRFDEENPEGVADNNETVAESAKRKEVFRGIHDVPLPDQKRTVLSQGKRGHRPEPVVDIARRNHDVDFFPPKKVPEKRQRFQVQIVSERKLQGSCGLSGFPGESGSGPGAEDISVSFFEKSFCLGNMIALLSPVTCRTIQVENAKFLIQVGFPLSVLER